MISKNKNLQIKLTLCLTVLGVLMFSKQLLASETSKYGSVCLGPNLAKANHFDWKKHLHIQIGNEKKAYFTKEVPRVVYDKLDLNKKYRVKVYYGEKVLESWWLKFSRLNTQMVTIYRGAGAWHMLKNIKNECKWYVENP